LNIIATGMGIVDLDTPEVIEQLEAKHPKRKRRVPSFSEFGVPRRGPVDADVVRKGRKLRRRVGADGWRNEHTSVLSCSCTTMWMLTQPPNCSMSSPGDLWAACCPGGITP
jgi:hypothetical protein